MPDTPVLMTVDDVARTLQFKPETIQSWLRKGILHGIKVGKEWRVSSQELSMWIEAHQKASTR